MKKAEIISIKQEKGGTVMLSKKLSPEEKFNMGVTLEKAIKELSACDPRTVCLNSAVIFNREKNSYILPYLNRKYFVNHSNGEVSPCSAGAGEVSLHLQILFLHYLSNARGTPLQDEWITFKELPGGQIYVGPYQNRTIRPLLQHFGAQPEKLLSTALDFGGQPVDFGDQAVTFHVFPRVPLTFVLWEGDEEFPPAGNILYDASAADYLHTEDYALLPGLIIWEMAAHMAK